MNAKTVIITGASTGIGSEIAKKFSTLRYNVVINYLFEDGNQDIVAAQCKELGANDVLTIQADVSKLELCENLINTVIEKYGSIYALINNAGITRDALIIRMTEKQFDDTVNANLKTVFNMSKLVVPHMLKAREGRIISLSSVVGIYGNQGQTNYAATKAGIIGFTKSLAKEIGSRGITVNAIAPGFIETAMTKAMPENAKISSVERIALRRYGQMSDVANAAAFLASDEASYITAHVLNVDGGISL